MVYFLMTRKLHEYLQFIMENIESDPNNYRPISVLPMISNKVEKIVFNQLYTYLIENDLLGDSQHGFRSMHSTHTALLETTNDS